LLTLVGGRSIAATRTSARPDRRGSASKGHHASEGGHEFGRTDAMYHRITSGSQKTSKAPHAIPLEEDGEGFHEFNG
jgi:hypothetical protein